MFFWDLGKAITNKIISKISDNPILIINCQDDVYVGRIIGLIREESGTFGDVLGWSRLYRKPWKNVLLLSNVQYKLKWGNSPINDLLKNSKSLYSNFYEFSGSTENELTKILKDNGLYPEIYDEHFKEIPPITIEDKELVDEKITHDLIEGILIDLGNILGFETYTPDKSKIFKDRTLGEMTILQGIPNFTYPRIVKNVKGVDVIWFNDDFPHTCFEVEHTTNITEGLLRLYQIKAISCKFFIIAPSSRKTKFDREILKDPFREIRNRYSFRSYEQLLEFYRIAQEYHDKKKHFLD